MPPRVLTGVPGFAVDHGPTAITTIMDTVYVASDSALVEDCLSGDQQAWNQLLDRYKRLIYAVTVRFGLDSEDRHDVFQSVCLEILKNLSSLRSGSSLRYWVLTITIRQCSSMRRRLQRSQTEPVNESSFLVHDPRPNTLDVYVEIQRAETVREAMNELPERCRKLLHLLFFSEDKPQYEQLGDMLSCSKDSIGSARLRCLDRLRRILAEKGF